MTRHTLEKVMLDSSHECFRGMDVNIWVLNKEFARQLNVKQS